MGRFLDYVTPSGNNDIAGYPLEKGELERARIQTAERWPWRDSMEKRQGSASGHWVRLEEPSGILTAHRLHSQTEDI
jgi:hypothetical protein